ncbi:unnamed protein product [Anisakis simplex]|uniref:Nbl1_Borealin_N domain-containing protein n=1 Tax=Anisakis simplex TaxID=6269 RepID=A0A0M3KEF4_ANISI|nr:unnamed protein product [Anisakis simplex]
MVRELEASAQDVRIMTAFSRSLSKRIETVEDMSSRKRSLTATSNSEELVSLTEQLRLETPHPKGSLANQQKLRFEEIDSELKPSTVPAPSKKPINTTTSSTVRRPPRKPKARQQDLKKVLMEQNTDMAGIAATLTASSVRNVMITPSSSRRLRPVLQRAVKTPAASAFYKDIDSVIDEEAEA